MIILRKKSDHILPVYASPLICAVTCHPLQIVTLLHNYNLSILVCAPSSKSASSYHLVLPPYWNLSHTKRAPHYMLSGKCKWKQQWDNTTHLSELPKSRTPMPNARGRGATGTLTHYWQECQIVHQLWKTVWWFVTQLNIHSPWFRNCASWYLPKGVKNLYPY